MKGLISHPITIGLGYLALMACSVFLCVSVFGQKAGPYFSILTLIAIHTAITGINSEIYSNKILRTMAAMLVIAALSAGIYHL